jgi:hypothetical protein
VPRSASVSSHRVAHCAQLCQNAARTLSIGSGSRISAIGSRAERRSAPQLSSPRHRSCGHTPCQTWLPSGRRGAVASARSARSYTLPKRNRARPPAPTSRVGSQVCTRRPPSKAAFLTQSIANVPRSRRARPAGGRRGRAWSRASESARDEAVCARAWLVHLQIGRRGGARRPQAPKWWEYGSRPQTRPLTTIRPHPQTPGAWVCERPAEAQNRRTRPRADMRGGGEGFSPRRVAGQAAHPHVRARAHLERVRRLYSRRSRC